MIDATSVKHFTTVIYESMNTHAYINDYSDIISGNVVLSLILF
jgi:hypothetical protein